MWVGDPIFLLRVYMYCDADFAGDIQTQRSTAGIFLALCGPHTLCSITWISTRQSCMSSCTPEAEMVSGHVGVKKVLLPHIDLWIVLLPAREEGDYLFVFCEDNTAMISVIQSGKNLTMKYLHRAHGISIAALHERLSKSSEHRDPVFLTYTKSARMRADIFTKAIDKYGIRGIETSK